jgi:hypothetical protein
MPTEELAVDLMMSWVLGRVGFEVEDSGFGAPYRFSFVLPAPLLLLRIYWEQEQGTSPSPALTRRHDARDARCPCS